MANLLPPEALGILWQLPLVAVFLAISIFYLKLGRDSFAKMSTAHINEREKADERWQKIVREIHIEDRSFMDTQVAAIEASNRESTHEITGAVKLWQAGQEANGERFSAAMSKQTEAIQRLANETEAIADHVKKLGAIMVLHDQRAKNADGEPETTQQLLSRVEQLMANG